jgi:hypothetical protein
MDEANFETLTKAELVKMNLNGAETPLNLLIFMQEFNFRQTVII